MKTRLLVVLLVSTLVLASIAPMAFAQASGGDVTIVDCSQVQNLFVQGQYGNANASAQYNSDAVAIVAQELNISQDQANACLVNLGGDGGGGGGDDADESTVAKESTAEGDSTVTKALDGEENVLAGTDPGGTLPKTGGPGSFALAAGCALLGLGLVFNRIAR